jgi:HEAT repeat protein
MAEKADELKKMVGLATDLDLTDELRIKAIERIGNIGTHEALLALLNLAGNEALLKDERARAAKHARELIRAGH